MDEPDSSRSRDDYANGDDPVVPPLHVLPHDHHADTHQDSHDEGIGRDDEKPESRQPRKPWWREQYIRREKIGWDRAIELIFAGVIVLFSLLQYLSSRSTSNQIQTIIDAANQIKSAAWTFSGAAQGINNAGWSAVGKLQDQANQIKRFAGASESAATTAQTTLWASQGAYVITDKPSFETGLHQARIPINNVGHMDSGEAQLAVYEQTDRVAENGKVGIPVESHEQTLTINSIPMGLNTNYSWAKVSTPKATPFGIIDGTQIIMIVGSITYEIGKGSSAKRNWDFCYITRAQNGANAYESIPCDPNWMIENLKKTNPEYQKH